MRGVRDHRAMGRIFSSIAITALQRKTDNDTVLFEITLRLNHPAP
jgi:hypothetical protein